ncbi:hypothetical protein VT47_12775 [Pseudomonas syringae pv. syringae]|jgi:uncharacterized protein YaaW (UPF0174 family)|nr:hypothetical protein VT47_12775 [Pseudomonas syringae pv. syringae]PPS42147.1 hypothetical protein B0F86_12970 [Pseudomonas syringae]
MKGAAMSYENDVINGDKELLTLLSAADAVDVGALVDFLTDFGSGRLAMSSDVQQVLLSAKQKAKYSRDTLLLLIRELQLFGGNSVANLVRRTGVPYAEIVRDVAKYVHAEVTGKEAIEVLELKILQKLVTKLWEKMTEQERAEFAGKVHADNGVIDVGLAAVLSAIGSGGLGAARAGVMGVAAVAPLLAEGAFTAGAVAVGGRAATALLGVVGIAIASAAGVHMAAKEAYRVTLPCVAQIAYIRQKHRGAADAR